MKKEIKELEKVTVKNLTQLNKALEPFMADTTIRRLLIEGMDIAKRQADYIKRAGRVADELYGGYYPAMPAAGHHYLWVDALIGRRLNGKRDGLKIVWDIEEGKFAFDPWLKHLEQINGSKSDS